MYKIKKARPKKAKDPYPTIQILQGQQKILRTSQKGLCKLEKVGTHVCGLRGQDERQERLRKGRWSEDETQTVESCLNNSGEMEGKG